MLRFVVDGLQVLGAVSLYQTGERQEMEEDRFVLVKFWCSRRKGQTQAGYYFMNL